MSLKKNTFFNLAGTGLPLLVGALTIPYLIRQLGVEAFGILTLVWALIGYFSLFDFGLGRALTQQVAISIAGGKTSDIPAIVKSGLLFTALTGLVGGLILAVLAQPLGNSWLKVADSLRSDTASCLLLAAIGIPLTTVATGLRGVLEAYEDFKIVNILRIFLGVANFGLPALSVYAGAASLTMIVFSLIAARLIALFLHWVYLQPRLAPRWWQVKTSTQQIKALFSFGAWMTVSNVISPLMVTADRFVISAVLGAGIVAYYTVPFEVIVRFLILPGALTSALFPRLAAVIKSDPELAAGLYRKSLKVVAMTMLPLCVATVLLSHWGLSLWLGAAFADNSWKIVSILSVGIFFNALAFVPFATIQAAGDTKRTAQLHLVELLVYLPVLFLLLQQFGLIGAALAWTLRVILDFALLSKFAGTYRTIEK